EDSVGRWNVSVIASDGGTNMSMVRYEVIGGIKANPAQMRKQHIDPGVGGVGGGSVVVFAAAVKVSRDVTSGDAHQAQQGDHGVRKVLTDALATDDGLVD